MSKTQVPSSAESLKYIKKATLRSEWSNWTEEHTPFDNDFDMPAGKEFQQTLRRHFVLGGIGLHSADYTYIRGQPAPATEGRYFVLVPQGTISDDYTYERAQAGLEKSAPERFYEKKNKVPEAKNRDNEVEAFLAYHKAKSKGYRGPIEDFEDDFFKEDNRAMVKETSTQIDIKTTHEAFTAVAKSSDEVSIPATIEFARGEVHFTVLERNGFTVSAVEHLLAALEACGVDNCRIELEGGREVPVIDGSAQGWTTIITRAGVVACKEEQYKWVIKVPKPVIMTGDDGAFLSVTPSETRIITAGWDAISRGAPCMGRSWYTWDVKHDSHFHYAVAPAKTFFHSEFELDALYDSGLVQAGPTLCAIVGLGETFHDPGAVTFPEDEAARHKVIDLTGDLALLTDRGHGGLPVGHFVSWNADHALQLKFCVHLWNEAIRDGLRYKSFRPQYAQLKQENVSPKQDNRIQPVTNNHEDKFAAQIRENEDIEKKAIKKVRTVINTEPSLQDLDIKNEENVD